MGVKRQWFAVWRHASQSQRILTVTCRDDILHANVAVPHAIGNILLTV
jgi:hypothetical protein